MDTVKILHTGDNHLGSLCLNMNNKAKERQEELKETFSRTITLANEEKVDALLIAGDLFDSNKPDKELVEFVNSEFERISHIKVFISLGNHDYDIDCQFSDNVHLFKDYIEKINVGNADIYGISFAEEHCSNYIAEGLKAENPDAINIFLIHGETAKNGMYNPMSDENIKYTNMDYIALGHTHSHNGFQKVGGVCFSYCGIPEARAFDECGCKGVILAEITKSVVNAKFVPVCKREYAQLDFDVTGFEDNYEIALELCKTLANKDNAYRVTLTGERSAFIDVLFIKSIIDKEIYFTEIIDETTEILVEDCALKDIFIEKCKNESALKYGLAALRGEKVTVE